MEKLDPKLNDKSHFMIRLQLYSSYFFIFFFKLIFFIILRGKQLSYIDFIDLSDANYKNRKDFSAEEIECLDLDYRDLHNTTMEKYCGIGSKSKLAKESTLLGFFLKKSNNLILLTCLTPDYNAYKTNLNSLKVKYFNGSFFIVSFRMNYTLLTSN